LIETKLILIEIISFITLNLFNSNPAPGFSKNYTEFLLKIDKSWCRLGLRCYRIICLSRLCNSRKWRFASRSACCWRSRSFPRRRTLRWKVLILHHLDIFAAELRVLSHSYYKYKSPAPGVSKNYIEITG